MANVRDVADYLLQLSGREPETTLITQLHLQKLLYYVQGWSIALHGNPMFLDRIEAWTHGPVVPTIYHEFKRHADKPIPIPLDEPALSEDERGTIASIWEGYKCYSASGLRNMTHREAPWMEAREGFDSEDRCSQEISQGTMRDFFRREFNRRAMPGLELERLERAEREFEQGGGIPMEEVFAG